jgi:hypothetical protein
MKGVGIILGAFIALAVFTAAMKVLVLCVIVLLLLAFVRNPRETFGAVVGFLFLGLLGRFPVPMIILSIALVLFGIASQKGR